MGLRIIAGRAGSGKTTRCFQEIGNKARQAALGEALILLVPEQATFQNERTLLAQTGLCGSLRVQVLSFRRLAWRVFQETGGIVRQQITDTGRRMILRALVEQHKDELVLYKQQVNKIGFYDELTQALAELKRYKIAPEQLGSPPVASPVLKRKLQDLQLIYNYFEQYIADLYTDPEDMLTLLAEKAAYSQLIGSAEFWVDGFSGFTPQELQVLAALLCCSRQVNVALCLDPACLGQVLYSSDLFYWTNETCRQLQDMALRCGRPLSEVVRLTAAEAEPRFKAAPELAWLEQNLFASRPQPSLKLSAAGCSEPNNCGGMPGPSIRLFNAVNRQAEVEAAACGILRLVREQGLRWRDCVIIVRRAAVYQEQLISVLEQYQIPYFLDSKQTVLHHPLLTLVRAALVCAQDNWRWQTLFTYLKNDLLPVNRNDIDRLENYVLARGITGRAWTEEQVWEEEDNKEKAVPPIDSIRRLAIRELSIFIAAVRPQRSAGAPLEQTAVQSAESEIPAAEQQRPTVLQISEALWQLLAALQADQTLFKWAQADEEKGNILQARQHRAVWDGLLVCLEQLVEVFGAETMSLEEYGNLLDAGLADLKPGQVPSTLDQVLIVEIERSRTPEVQAAFVLGLNEGLFPAPMPENSLFSELERQELVKADLQLAPGNQERSFQEQFLFYLALTRASRWLTVSCSLADEEGHAQLPSLFFQRLRGLLQTIGVQEQLTGGEPLQQAQQSEFLLNKNKALTIMIDQFRQAHSGKLIAPVWWQIYNVFLTDRDLCSRLQRLSAGLFRSNQEPPLADSLAQELYGSPLWLSVSQLERYQRCRFSFYLYNGLRLRERDICRFNAPDLGELFHEILRELEQQLLRIRRQAGSLEEHELTVLLDEIIERQLPLVQNRLLLSSERYLYLNGKLREIMHYVAGLLAEHDRRSAFSMLGAEISFDRNGDLPPWQVPLADGSKMYLRGRIDRLDWARDGDVRWLRVIDYKSGEAAINLNDIYSGRKLQLLLYLCLAQDQLPHLLSLSNNAQLKAGAMLYFPLKKPLVKSKLPLDAARAEQERRKKLKMKGVIFLDKTQLHLLDEQIVAGVSSDLVQAGLNKNGELTARSQVYDQKQWRLLRGHLLRLLQACGQEIKQGLIDVNPYRYGRITACKYCEFKTVCGFEPKLGCSYRQLRQLAEELIWSRLEEQADSAEVGHKGEHVDAGR